MKENRFFIFAILISLALHWYFLRCETEYLSEQESAIYIPVTLTLASHISREQPVESREMIIPKLPGAEKGGLVFKQGTITKLAQRYIEIVAEEIEKRRFSPPESRYYRLIGNVKIAFSIDRYGRFHNITIVRSSGDALLDATALKAIKNTDGRVKRPAWAGTRVLNVSMVLKYQYSL